MTTGTEQILSTEYSSVQTVTPSVGATDLFYDLAFTDVPCIEDTWNRFDVQVKADVTSHVWLEYAVCAETRSRSEPESAGASNLKTLTF